LLIRGNEVFIQELSDTLVRQGARPECLRIVSREFLPGKISGDLYQEHQFMLLLGEPTGFVRA
jgi:hypothetical protein